jgi:hypothetical protein
MLGNTRNQFSLTRAALIARDVQEAISYRLTLPLMFVCATRALLVFAIASLLGAAGQLRASTKVINFDDYPSGSFSLASSNRYESVGVIFNRDIPLWSPEVVAPNWWVQIAAAGGVTLPNVLPLTDHPGAAGHSIEMFFVVPGRAIPATTDFFSCLLDDSEVGSGTGLVEVFDAYGNVLASTNPVTPSTGTVPIEFHLPGIASVRFTDSSYDGMEVDNITFNTPVDRMSVNIRLSQVEVCWSSLSNKTYQVQYRSDLTTNNWTNLGASIPGTGARQCSQDPIPLGQPQRFYRVLEQ